MTTSIIEDLSTEDIPSTHQTSTNIVNIKLPKSGQTRRRRRSSRYTRFRGSSRSSNNQSGRSRHRRSKGSEAKPEGFNVPETENKRFTTQGGAMRQRKVQDFYDRKSRSRSIQRSKSKIINLRNFNNWIKRVAIVKYCKKGSCILDVCCGRGADIFKFQSVGAEKLFGFDLSKQSIITAQERARNSSLDTMFRQADCFNEDISKYVNQSIDFASCQFALHYSFENETLANDLLKNISKGMRKGATFVTTIPNASEILRRLRRSEGYVFGNSIYKIEFDEISKENIPDFGVKYIFTLSDAIDEVPEYIVKKDVLEKIASKHGLKMILEQRFDVFFKDSVRKPQYLKMFRKRVGKVNILSVDEKSVTQLYSIVIFRKI